MASKRIDISLQGKDNTSSAFNSVTNSISKLNSESGKAGTTIGQSIGKGAQTASSSIGKLGSTSASVFHHMIEGASSAGSSLSKTFDGLSGSIAGLAGGYGILQMAQQAWAGSTAAEFNKAYLATKIGAAEAERYTKIIQKIVAEVPGDDTFMNQLLTGALTKQTTLTVEELTKLGNVAADYMAMSAGMGKSSIETQNDLNEYVKTGNTTQLERDSILRTQLDTLEDQATVSKRITALNKAMFKEGYLGISQLDTTAQKWDKFQGLVQLTLTTLADRLLPTIGDILTYVIKLDESTGGWSTTVGTVVAGFGLLLPAIGMAWKPLSAMVKGTSKIAGYIKKAVIQLWKYVAAAKAADKADDGIGTGKGGGTSGKITSAATNTLWNSIPSAMAGWFAAGGGLSGALAAAGGGIASAGATIATSCAMGFSAALGPAFLGLFEEGSLFGKNFDLAANWAPQWAQIKKDIGGIGAYAGKTWDDIGLLGKNMVKGLAGVWKGMQVNAGAAFNHIDRAWKNTVSWILTGADRAASSANEAWNWIRNGAASAFSTIGNAWGRLKSWISRGVTGVINIGSSAISKAWDAITGLYNYVKDGVTGVINIITGGNHGPGGPRGPEDNIYFSYESYGGWQKNAWTGSNTMSGNCADMTTGLISRYGGSMVSGTWNGNPHVWWKRPDGTEFDPARKALQGTGSPPPQGPSQTEGNQIIIHGDVYGFDDFTAKVEQAQNRIVGKINRIF